MTLEREQLIAELARLLEEAGVADPHGEAIELADAAARHGADNAAQAAIDLARKRSAGTPLEYLTRKTSFMDVEVHIAPGALIPREETALLGQTALRILKEAPELSAPRVIDMCCGSGNLTCAIASHHPSAQVWASDLTDGAVSVARANVEHLHLANRVTVLQGDLFQPLAGLGLENTIDMVVCNPPYISTGKLETERAELLKHEPREAFDGGPYGVSIFQRVLRDALAFLKPGGHLLFEIGAGQERQVSLLFGRTAAYEPVTAVPDASGTARVIVGRRK